MKKPCRCRQTRVAVDRRGRAALVAFWKRSVSQVRFQSRESDILKDSGSAHPLPQHYFTGPSLLCSTREVSSTGQCGCDSHPKSVIRGLQEVHPQSSLWFISLKTHLFQFPDISHTFSLPFFFFFFSPRSHPVPRYGILHSLELSGAGLPP